MFTSATVIIIGAGSSVDYGLPLGKTLWNRIVSDCEQLPLHLSHFIEQKIAPTSDSYFRQTSLENPKAYAFFWLMRDPRGGIDRGQAQALAETVKRANVHDNVDEFIRDHPSLKKPLHALIASNLFEHLYAREHGTSEWKLRARMFDLVYSEHLGTVKNVENWIRHFIGLCRNQLPPKSQGVIPVVVISFNYDRLMETVLREFWNQSETTYHAFDDCFEFLYPYGAFSELKRTVTDAGPWLVEQSEHICIPKDGPAPQKTVARQALGQARAIYMLGFSCSRANMEWLGPNAKLGKKVFAQNYNSADQRLSRVLREMGARSESGSMIQLVRGGFFEQRPTRLVIGQHGHVTYEDEEAQ